MAAKSLRISTAFPEFQAQVVTTRVTLASAMSNGTSMTWLGNTFTTTVCPAGGTFRTIAWFAVPDGLLVSVAMAVFLL